MTHLRKFLLLLIICYNYPVFIAVVILDQIGVAIKPQEKKKDFSLFQMIILTIIASFFSTLFHMIFGEIFVYMMQYAVVPPGP